MQPTQPTATRAYTDAITRQTVAALDQQFIEPYQLTTRGDAHSTDVYFNYQDPAGRHRSIAMCVIAPLGIAAGDPVQVTIVAGRGDQATALNGRWSRRVTTPARILNDVATTLRRLGGGTPARVQQRHWPFASVTPTNFPGHLATQIEATARRNFHDHPYLPGEPARVIGIMQTATTPCAFRADTDGHMLTDIEQWRVGEGWTVATVPDDDTTPLRQVATSAELSWQVFPPHPDIARVKHQGANIEPELTAILGRLQLPLAARAVFTPALLSPTQQDWLAAAATLDRDPGHAATIADGRTARPDSGMSLGW